MSKSAEDLIAEARKYATEFKLVAKNAGVPSPRSHVLLVELADALEESERMSAARFTKAVEWQQERDAAKAEVERLRGFIEQMTYWEHAENCEEGAACVCYVGKASEALRQPRKLEDMRLDLPKEDLDGLAEDLEKQRTTSQTAGGGDEP